MSIQGLAEFRVWGTIVNSGLAPGADEALLDAVLRVRGDTGPVVSADERSIALAFALGAREMGAAVVAGWQVLSEGIGAAGLRGPEIIRFEVERVDTDTPTVQ